MTTMSGVISVDKYFFGESTSLQDRYHIQDLGHSPADKHLRNLCASCHRGKEKTEYEAVHENSRGGGCLACHLNYSAEAEKQLNLYKQQPAGAWRQ